MRRLLVLLAACADPGDPPVQTPLVTVTTDKGFTEVVTSTYTMSFSAGGIHLPDHLQVGGSELFATTNPIDECNLESLAGIGIFPAVSIVGGDNHGDDRHSEIVDTLAGPGVAQIKVTYDVEFSCPDPQMATGESIFTFFPTGRIVREDRNVVPATTTLSNATGPCGCDNGGGTPFFFTSFWAFEQIADPAAHVDRDGNPTTGGTKQACTIYPDRAVAVSWETAETRVHQNMVSSHILDFVPGNAQTLSSTTIGNTFSAIQVLGSDPGGAGECANLLEPLNEHAIDVGGMRIERTGDAGIYEDIGMHGTTFDITTPEGVPPGWAISLDFGGRTHAEITRDPPVAGDVAIVQPDGDRFILLFPDALAPGERITIEPK